MDPKLYKAVAEGNLTYFEWLSNVDGVELTQVTSDQNNTILHVAAKCGKYQIAEKIIDSCELLVHQTNSKGDTALHMAARLGHLQIVQLLLDRSRVIEVEGQEKLPKMVNADGDTALHEAVRKGHYEVVKLLIAEDKQLTEVTNVAGDSPLFLAVDRRFYEIAYHILDSAAPNCSYAGRKSMNVLHAAIIRGGNTSIFRRILASFYAPEAEFVARVLQKKSSVIAEADASGWIPLHYAANLGNLKVVEILVKFYISVANVKDNEGMSALHIAAKEGHNHVVRKLVQNWPNITELSDNKGRTALHSAAQSGKERTVDTFLNLPVYADFINARDTDGNTPFHSAVLGEYDIISSTSFRTATDTFKRHAKIDKYSINQQGLTPLDMIAKPMLRRSVEETKKTEMKQESAERTDEASTAVYDANVMLLVATIIASVTFTAGMTMPGGYHSDDKEEIAGTAVLAGEPFFQLFVLFDATAFILSSTLCLALSFVLPASDKKVLNWCEPVLFLSALSMNMAFITGLGAVLPYDLFRGMLLFFSCLCDVLLVMVGPFIYLHQKKMRNKRCKKKR